MSVKISGIPIMVSEGGFGQACSKLPISPAVGWAMGCMVHKAGKGSSGKGFKCKVVGGKVVKVKRDG